MRKGRPLHARAHRQPHTLPVVARGAGGARRRHAVARRAGGVGWRAAAARAAAHAQLSESYSQAALYENAVIEAHKAREAAGGEPFLRQLQALSKALAGMGDYQAALGALEQAATLECREEERVQLQQEMKALRKAATEVATALEAGMAPLY